MKHGLRHTRLYRIWLQMKNRCFNKNTSRYVDYGGRGITVCEEWRNDFKAFYDWSISNGYSDELTIDRINNNDGYKPDNCRWVDIHTQARNKRNNRLLTFKNETHCIEEWSKITGLTRACIINRLRYGWTIEDTLTKPRGYNWGARKKILCVETGITYESSKEASKKLNIDSTSIRNCCRGTQNTAGGYHWRDIEEDE